jgi:hypothetical protein
MTRTHTYRLAGTFLLALGLIPIACTGDQTPPEEADMTDAQADVMPMIPPSFVYIQHGVADFDAWLVEYDGFNDERAAANVVEIWVYRDLDQPDVIHALHGAEDVETLRSFTQMENLAAAMQKAGVMGPPRFDFMNLVDGTAPEMPVASQYSVLVAHEVADWDQWKAAFDAHTPDRDAAGLTTRGVSRGADDSNRVYINFAVSDLDKARAFIASDDLKTAMEGAGVVGVPEIYFAETVRPM